MITSTSGRRDGGPLKGIRVLEFGQIAAGPFTGSLLADLGADVVKIENPDGGDGMRNWPPLARDDAGGTAFSENFASLNRNKRSITANIKNERDIARIWRLASRADIFIENYRPGALVRAGLGYSELAALNPRLVYCSISGYGQTGEYATRGAFDVTVQAFSGLMSVTGNGSEPVKCGVPVADFGAGLYAAYVIMAALWRARETGLGSEIDCSMLGSLIGMSALQTSEFFGTGKSPRAMGSAHPRNAPYQAYRASDDYFVIAAGNNALWAQVAAAVDMPELVDDPRFDNQLARARHQDELRELLEARFAKATKAEWIAEMDRRGVPCSPINTFEDVLEHPHLEQVGLVKPLTLPNGVQTKTTAFPVKLSDFEFSVRRPPPELGEHNGEIDEEWLASGAAA